MSSGNKNTDTDRSNQKSINPYVTVKGNILVSKCCGQEMAYTVSDKYGFNLFDFCPQCLNCCDILEVKESEYNRDIYLNENDEFEYEGYDSKNFEIIPKCLSQAFTMACPYCDEVENIEPAKNVEQFEDSMIWSCHECCKFWEVDEKGNIATEVE